MNNNIGDYTKLSNIEGNRSMELDSSDSITQQREE